MFELDWIWLHGAAAAVCSFFLHPTVVTVDECVAEAVQPERHEGVGCVHQHFARYASAAVVVPGVEAQHWCRA